jgi:TetR/AcrR family transcriptional regulator, transcriptional repressor for nem operon
MSQKSEATRERILTAAENLVMTKGFTGTSIDEILKESELSKGAFFHYFKGKGELARVLIETHTEKDLGLFEHLLAKAEAEADDPYEQAILFLKHFETYVSKSRDLAPGCMYAAYTYEGTQMEPAIREFVADTLRKWTSMYVRKFQEVIDLYEPALPVTARQLAETIVSIIEGALVLQRAYGDNQLTARQSEQFRNYVELLFGASKRKSGKKTTARKSVESREVVEEIA